MNNFICRCCGSNEYEILFYRIEKTCKNLFNEIFNIYNNKLIPMIYKCKHCSIRFSDIKKFSKNN